MPLGERHDFAEIFEERVRSVVVRGDVRTGPAAAFTGC
jgi:hypothetical protein